MTDNKEELFPVTDAEGRILGKITRGEAHGGARVLHPVVHLHVFNSKGELFLQRRPLWKDIQPGRWDTAVGGHADCGETPEEAMRRETREEIGLEGFTAEFVTRYLYESQRERELVHVFRTTTDIPPTPSEEVAEGRFFSLEEIRERMGTGFFTPNFESEIQRIGII